MPQEELVTDEIEVTVDGTFTTHHHMETAAGVLGRFTFPASRSTGVFHRVDGQELTVRRVSWWRGEHELRRGQTVLATSHPRGIFRRRTVVLFGGRQYELEPTSVWNRSWRLADEAGATLLEIQPRGAFRRGAHLRVGGPLDADLLVFAYYLVRLRWQQQSAAAAAAAS